LSATKTLEILTIVVIVVLLPLQKKSQNKWTRKSTWSIWNQSNWILLTV